MQERATVNGKAVRKRTVHQETTITKAGALLESFYRQELKSTDANEEIECNSDDPENNETKIQNVTQTTVQTTLMKKSKFQKRNFLGGQNLEVW